MAKPTTQTFSKFIVDIDTSATSTPAWTAPCGFTSKALALTAATSKTSVPDCDDPEAPAWEETGVSSLSGSITGSGVLATENSALWEAWFDAATSKDIRIRIPTVGFRTGKGVLTSLGATTALNSDGNRVQRSITIESDGPWTWTSGDPT